MQAASSPERWEQVQRLYEEVAALAPEAQDAWLERVCGDNEALRRQLEALLKAHEAAPDFFDDLAQAIFHPTLPEGSSHFQRLAHYEVVERLGGGGMGEVYKAQDTKLGRTVALKFLNASLSDHEKAKARFLQEARAAAALDHPNIGTIYEIGEVDGQLFIAMALYQGETLRQKIDQGPFPLDEALDYVVQMARGLATAHNRGIVHRDVKPSNVMVTDPASTEAAGLLKIVDFGLAKVADVTMTQTGTTVGTLAYMSPEQARGEEVDHRTDIWALGVVLYEMLAGERPFKGDYEHAILYEILNKEPVPLRDLNPEVPEDLEHVVTMCLEKEREHRYPSMADLLADLEVLKQGGAVASSRAFELPRAKPAPVPWRVFTGIGLLVALLVLVIPVLRQFTGPGGAARPDHLFLAVLPFDNVGDAPENQAFIDGLVYTVTSKLTEMEQFQDALSVVPARDVLQAGLLSTGAAADRFKVNLVVSGSVQRTGSGVRITLQLVDPRVGKTLASRQLDEPMTDIGALQDGVVFKLAELLEIELHPAFEKTLTAGRTAVPVAYDFYTRALGYLQRFEDETNIDAAISLFQLAIKEDSSYALAYAGLGEAYLRKYQASNVSALVQEAVRNGEQAVALNDELAPVHVSLGMIYFETGHYEQAELAYLRALALEPKNAAAYHELGDVHSRQHKDQMAEASYQEAIALKPDYWLFHNDLGQLYHRLGRHKDAIPQFEKVIALQPDNPWGYNNVGAQYALMGRQQEAITWYQKAARVNPNATRATAVAHWNLGGIYYGQDDFARAARMYEKVVALQATDRDAWENLGDAYYWAGNPEAARTAWQRAVGLAKERLTVNPKDVDILGALAEDYARLGAQDSARLVLDRLVALDELSTMSLISVGKAYEILKERDQALRYLKAALDRGQTPEFLEYSSWLDELRQDPRYRKLVQSYRSREE